MSVVDASFSDTLLNSEHLTLADYARNFSNKEIRPLAEKIDKEHYYPTELIKSLSEMGFMGMTVSPDYSGAGLDTLSYVTALEELSVACASTSVIMSVNNSLVCHPLEKFGSDHQKENFLKDVASGKKLGCYCLSEPGSGSDAVAMTTTAKRTDRGWLLNGVKNFITNGKEAETAIVFAIVDAEKKHKGIAAFVVESSREGYQILKLEDKLGIRGSSTAQIALTNVEVPEENLIGNDGDGFKIAMTTLDAGRIGIATQALGIHRAVFEEVLLYAQEREAFGKQIYKHGAIQDYIAYMRTELEASRLLIRSAALMKDQGKDYSRAAAQAKLYAAEKCMEAAVKGVQILGGYGYVSDYAMERHFRDAKITEIYEGTSEIQRLVITSSLIREFKK